jgi:hypothetical protein
VLSEKRAADHICLSWPVACILVSGLSREVLRDPASGFDVFLAIIVVPDGTGPVLYPWAVTYRTVSQTGVWVEPRG